VSAQTIDQPFVSSTALRSVNFFNGRLLTGDDLRREQATQEARLQRLGRIQGSGVAEGLEVVETHGTSSKSRPVVTVAAGLALSRSGIALELPADVDVALYREDAPSDAEPGGLFADCQPFAPGTYTAGAGVYLLTVGPAEQGEGRAQVSGLGNDAAPCNVALSAEALRFRLIRLALEHAELVDTARLRNRVAYACFGTDALGDAVANPFGPPVTTYGLLDTLRAETLTDDEVPLATIGWSIDDGIQFVDLWSVRRGVTPLPGEGDWSSLVSARRRSEGEAMYLQFQAQIADMRHEFEPDQIHATDRFDALPPVGLLPIGGPGGLGFHYLTFFSGLTVRNPVFVEGGRLEELLRASYAYPPIDLSSGDVIWLYVVRENAQAADEGSVRQEFLAFSNGLMPYEGNAQFDLSHWDYANYSMRLA
jgi:hypothetical protein